MSLDQKRNNCSSETKDDWRVELNGLATEEYINSCTRITAIDYPGYLTFTSKDEELTRSQVHSNGKILSIVFFSANTKVFVNWVRGCSGSGTKTFTRTRTTCTRLYRNGNGEPNSNPSLSQVWRMRL